MFYLFFLPAIAFAILASHYGGWLGLLGGVAVFAAQIAILAPMGARTKKRAELAAAQAASQPPVPAPAPQGPAYIVATAPVGTPRPRDSPPPAPAPPPAPPPIQRGQYASYQDLRFDLGDPDRWHDNTLHLQLYQGMRNAVAPYVAVESGPDGTPAAMLAGDTPPPQEPMPPGERICTPFRSHDGLWVGIRHGGESLRFSPARLAGLKLEVGVPAKGAGGYRIFVQFDTGLPPKSAGGASFSPSTEGIFELNLGYSAARSTSLFEGLSQMAALYGVPVHRDTYSDC